MEGSAQAAVTPQGVRDGDPAVLTALTARRGPAVLAFCEAVCEPDRVPRAVAEAFARFRALVATVGDASGLDPEQFLLGATRHAAASMARLPSDGRGVLRVLGRGASPETYASVPALLAARADSMLSADDLERLSRLLERSPGCREVEAAFRRAERAYRSPPERPVPGDVVTLIVSAMQAAAPVADAFAVAAPPVGADAGTPVPAPGPEAGALAPVPQHDAPPAGAGEPVVAELLGGAEIVLPDLPQDLVPAAPAGEPSGGGDDDPAVEHHPADEIAPFLDEHPDAHDGDPADDARHPEIPSALDPVPAAEAEDDGAPPEPPIVPAHAPAGGAARVARLGRPRLRGPGRPRPRLPHGGGLTLPRGGRSSTDADQAVAQTDHGPVFRVLLPAVAVLIAVLVMLAVAGVFGGGDPSPAAILAPLARAGAPLAALMPSA